MRDGRYISVFLFTAALLIGTWGCGPVVDEHSPEGLTALADEALGSGDPAEALDIYTTALDKYPGDIRAARWHLGQGRALFNLGRTEEAIERASEAIRWATDTHTTAGAMLLIASAEIKQGSYHSGIDTLADLDQDNLDRDEAKGAVELLRATLAEADMDYLTREPSSGWIHVFVLLELEERYAGGGELEKATLTGMEIDRLFPDAHDRYGRPEYGISEDGFVALVLPFTGNGSEYAERVASGVYLAFDRTSDLYSSIPQIITFDFNGDSAQLVSIIGSLGSNPLCLAVIGPLTSRNAEIAAPLSQQWDLPMITPTATSPILDDYIEYVYRLVVSQGNDAAAVAEYAVRRAGCSRLAVIHEYTAESVANAVQFNTVVEELGGEIVGMEGYETGDTDYRDQINAIKYLHPDGIFLPVDAWYAIQLAPQLRFYRVESDLFGTSGWDDEILIEQGGEYVEGAVFPVSFGSGSMNPATARFSYFYQREYDSLPTILAAQGYDTATIILTAWSGRIATRSSLEDHLEDLDIYFGATGMCTLGNVSIPRSAFPLVKVIDGEIVSIE